MWAALFCRVRHRPLIVWWEGIPHSDGTGRLRTLRRKLLLRCTSRVWGNGVETARSFAQYGVPSDQVDLGMTGIDTAFWKKAVDREREVNRVQIRNKLKLQGAVVLFVGRLDPIKGVSELLAALTAIAADPDIPQWSLLCVGAGPSSKDVAQWAATYPDVAVALTGFVQPEALPMYYAAADVFVLPSLAEPWGLVCLEALVAGLPQVTSSTAGAAPDLVTSSEIGDIVDPRDTERFAERLAERIHQAPVLVSERTRSDAVSRWSPTAAAIRGIKSIEICLNGKRSDSRRSTVVRETRG
jgi:glycosyltransferase involved in cell wall biosynthesis